MKPLWKISSGRFAGYRNDDVLYDAKGNNVGYFRDKVAYSLNGHYLGEMYDDDYIGKRTGGGASISSSKVGRVGIARVAHADRAGRAIAGWDDPDF
jgi:hypothetical protein